MVAWRYEISLLVSRRNFVSPRGHVISSMYCIDCMVNSKIKDLREYTINGILTDFFKLCECTLVSSLHVLSTKKKKSKMAEDLNQLLFGHVFIHVLATIL